MPVNRHISLLESGWTSVGRQHPLSRLHRRILRFNYEALVLLGPQHRSGAVHFEVLLLDAIGRVSYEPVVAGLHSQGAHRGYNWIQVNDFRSRFSFGIEPRIRHIYTPGLPLKAIESLCDLVPAGGHITVTYDCPGQEETSRCLGLGVPPVVTPLGYLMFNAGCGSSFMQWHSYRGCDKGPGKLQGFKALDSAHSADKAQVMMENLKDFLDNGRATLPELEPARRRARALLGQLEAQQIERVLASL